MDNDEATISTNYRWLPSELLPAKAKAADEGTTVTAVLRRALRVYVEPEPMLVNSVRRNFAENPDIYGYSAASVHILLEEIDRLRGLP